MGRSDRGLTGHLGRGVPVQPQLSAASGTAVAEV